MVFIKVLVNLSSATYTMNLQNPRTEVNFIGTSQIRRTVSGQSKKTTRNKME